MPLSDPSEWFLNYDDPRSNERVLVSMPTDMMRDARVLAGSREISFAELVRRLVTKEIVDEITKTPSIDLKKSFRGSLVPDQ